MKAHELQIGSVVHCAGKARSVIEVRKNHALFESGIRGGDYICAVGDLEPIPITPEWLERLGFEEMPSSIIQIWEHKKTKSEIEYVPYTVSYMLSASLSSTCDIHHVHQLQAAYSLFTGEMLTIKEG